MGAVTGALAIGGAIFGGVERSEESSAQTAALQQQLKELEISTKQKQIQNMQRLNNVMGNQMVIGASSGYELSSTSFNALSKEDLDNYAEDKNADALSMSFQKQAIDQQINNAQSAGEMGMLSSGISALGTGMNLWGNKLFEGSTTADDSGQVADATMRDAYAAANQRLPSLELDYRQSMLPSMFTQGVEI